MSRTRVAGPTSRPIASPPTTLPAAAAAMIRPTAVPPAPTERAYPVAIASGTIAYPAPMIPSDSEPISTDGERAAGDEADQLGALVDGVPQGHRHRITVSREDLREQGRAGGLEGRCQ